MSKIKCCGIMRAEDIAMVNHHRPDYAGFILAPGRKRTLTPDQAASLRKDLRADIAAVAVFVNQPINEILKAAKKMRADMIQLHGSENEAFLAELKARTRLPVIKAFSVKTERDLEAAEPSRADIILLDNGAGGTGTAFDWSLLSAVHRPFFLAGGITPENIGQALAVHPYAVDVSSGWETNGIKDETKLARLIKAAHTEGK